MARKRKADEEGGKPPARQRKKRPTLGNPDADPVRIHREYVERRLGGGDPATPDAYERALKQWHRLPGAVSVPATEAAAEIERSGEDDAPTAGENAAEAEEAAGGDEERPA